MRTVRVFVVVLVFCGLVSLAYGQEVLPDLEWEESLESSPLLEASTCSWTSTLPDTTAAPHGGVGFISNGCTATLIDLWHILTAAHCIVNEGADNYWANIWFYPNFNGTEANPPRFLIERGVVGAHDDTGGVYGPSDWAIARLAEPAYGVPAIAVYPGNNSGAPVMVSHYTRDPLYFNPDCATPPYADELGCTPGWPNAQWFGNAWWQNGFVSNGTITLDVNLGYNFTTAPGGGGASGSPHLVKDQNNHWRIHGVTHGAECNGVSGPWAGRFFRAPRFAANVAIASAPSSPANTGVFVVDSDLKRVVYRERKTSGSSDPFEFYTYLGGITSERYSRIAAFKLPGTFLPGIVVLTATGALWEMDREDQWSGPKSVSAPPASRSGLVLDIDAASSKNGVNSLYAVRSGGKLYRRQRVSTAAGADWRATWSTVIASDPYTYNRVTAIRHDGDGYNQAWVLTSTGIIRMARELARGWTAAATFTGPTLRSGQKIVDIDAAWTSQSRAMLFALSSAGRVYYREAGSTLSTSTWSSWKALPSLVDPGVPVNRGGVKLTTITASRWAETDAGTVVPVVFATDTWGNVYQTNYTQATNAWSNWMPFYGKRINSSQVIAD
jgi:hypothetical protein